MSLKYSTELEEIAYSKDAEALLKNADFVIRAEELTPGRAWEAFYAAGVKFSVLLNHYFGSATVRDASDVDDVLKKESCSSRNYDVRYFTWHGDGKTFLFFRGDAKRKVRSLPDRPQSPYR